MRQIDINDNTIDTEAEGWKEFQANGCFEVVYGNNVRDQFSKLIFGWNSEEYDLNDREFGLWAGYENQYGALSDSFNVPESVFKSLFPNDRADWNSSESAHGFECPAHETLAQTMARVANVFSQAGFVWNPY